MVDTRQMPELMTYTDQIQHLNEELTPNTLLIKDLLGLLIIYVSRVFIPCAH